MFKKFSIIILLLVCMIIPVWGEESSIEKEPVFKNQIGAEFSMMHGIGLNYQRRLSENWRLGITGGLLFMAVVDFGFNFQYNFYENSFFRTYGFVGGVIYTDYFIPMKESESDDETFRNFVIPTAGVGAGVELCIAKRVSIFFEFGALILPPLDWDFNDIIYPAFSIGAGFRF